MTSTISLVPIQALTSFNKNGVQMTGPFILVKTTPTTVAQQVQEQRRLKNQEPLSSKEPQLLRCKRRTDGKGLHNILPKPQPATVARRNERERKRVKQVNLGFETLRDHVPDGKKNKKLSKVDTLKSAVEYIKQLQQLLKYTEDGGNLEHDFSGVMQHNANSQNGLINERLQAPSEDVESDKENFSDEVMDKTDTNKSENNGFVQYSTINNNIDNSGINYNQLQTFSYNQENTVTYESDSTNSYYTSENFIPYESASCYVSDNYQYSSDYNNMQHSPATSYVSMQHSPSTSESLSESFSSEEDELPDLRSFFPL